MRARATLYSSEQGGKKMSSPHRQYTKELYTQLAYTATWLPGVPLCLGDVGTFTKGIFERVMNIKELGISFDVRQDKTPSQIDYSSERAVSISFKAAGETPKPMSQLTVSQAGFTIEMTRDNAIMFQAVETYSPSIEDQVSLGKRIVRLYKGEKWRPEYFVITEILVAKSATILISSAAKAQVEISVTGSVTPGGLNLADINAGLRLEHSRNMHTRIIATGGLTPLFKARCVKKKKLRPGELEFRGGPGFHEMTPEDIDYEE